MNKAALRKLINLALGRADELREETGHVHHSADLEIVILAAKLASAFRAPCSVFDQLTEWCLQSDYGGGSMRYPSSALEIAALGASPMVKRTLLKKLVQNGFYNHAPIAARLLVRSLNREEVFGLVDHYVNGAMRGDSTDERLMELANEYLVGNDVEKVRQKIGQHKKDFESLA